MAEKYGFDGVEVWGARPHAYAYDMDADAVSDILELKKRHQIEISMFTPEILAYPYSLTSGSRKEVSEAVDYLIRSAEAAAAMGAGYMQVTCPHPGYGVNRAHVYEQVVEALMIICSRAQKEGVALVMEALSPSEGNLLTTAEDLKRLISDVNSPALKAMMDVVPPVIANEPFAEYFDRLKDDLVYIHLANSDGKTEFHSQLDDGVIPFIDMMQVFKNYSYDGWCSIELLAPYFKDPELYLAQSSRLIKNMRRELSI
ncbi:MAG: TIM barrel protein [Bacillota bacterium]|nr:TIM barrel protein [Bacillota bacterium]